MSLRRADTALAFCCEAAYELNENIKWSVQYERAVKFLLIDKNRDHEKEYPIHRVQR
jgi:hypothetical protein